VTTQEYHSRRDEKLVGAFAVAMLALASIDFQI
jgi:hypothetical protein